MSRFVLDSSVAAGWILPDEDDARSAALLEQALATPPVAPAHWPAEIANVAWQARRRGRITEQGLAQAQELLKLARVEVEAADLGRAWTQGHALARRHGLTIYDALYLDLAMRRGLPLATYDRALAKAARDEGVRTP